MDAAKDAVAETGKAFQDVSPPPLRLFLAHQKLKMIWHDRTELSVRLSPLMEL